MVVPTDAPQVLSRNPAEDFELLYTVSCRSVNKAVTTDHCSHVNDRSVVHWHCSCPHNRVETNCY